MVTLPAKHGGEVALSGSYEALADAADRLNQKGIVAVPDNKGGVYRVLVSGLKNTAQLNTILGKQVAVSKTTEANAEKNSSTGIGEWLKHRKLKVAGLLYLIGDSTLFLSGITGGKAKEAMSGLLWAGGGITSTIYGDPGTNRQIMNIGYAMSDFMASQGVALGKDTALFNLGNNRTPGWMRRINGFLYKHPSEAHNAFYLVGSGTYFQSGLEKLRSTDPKRHAGWWQDMGVGATVGTGAAIGTFVGEKHKEGGAPPSNPIEWVKEKPLRVSGFLYMINNMFSFMSAYAERKEWKKQAALNPEAAAHDKQRFSHVFKFITTGVFVISNVFMSLSSRHNSETDKDHDAFKDDMIGGMAAEVIAAQPEAQRQQLINTTSIFLSKRYEIIQTQEGWEKILTEKVNGLLNSRRDAGKATEDKVTGEKEMKSTTSIPWTDKVSQPAELSPNSQRL